MRKLKSEKRNTSWISVWYLSHENSYTTCWYVNVKMKYKLHIVAMVNILVAATSFVTLPQLNIVHTCDTHEYVILEKNVRHNIHRRLKTKTTKETMHTYRHNVINIQSISSIMTYVSQKYSEDIVGTWLSFHFFTSLIGIYFNRVSISKISRRVN